jgi:hypothetical protein
VENAQPVGFGNLRILPTYSQVYTSGNVAVTWTSTPTHLATCNIGLNDYVVAFETDGSAEYYNIQTKTKAQSLLQVHFLVLVSKLHNGKMSVCSFLIRLKVIHLGMEIV